MNLLEMGGYTAAIISIGTLAITFIKIGRRDEKINADNKRIEDKQLSDVKRLDGNCERNWKEIEELRQNLKDHEKEQRDEFKEIVNKMNEMFTQVQLIVQSLDELNKKWRP